MAKTWLLMSVDGAAEHGGNDGYDDDPTFSYHWDSTVKNYANVSVGDRIVLWDKTTSLGVSVIDDISVEEEVIKALKRCPACGKAKISSRSKRSPKYRCRTCKSEFDTPDIRIEPVTEYRSNHGRLWVDLFEVFDAQTLRDLCLSPKSILSMRQMDGDAVDRALGPTAARKLDGVSTPSVPTSSGHQTRHVRVRRGQRQFRSKLIAEFGENCAITGPCPTEALEACHLYSYAERGVHDQDGGLLLRADLHSLLDRGLLRIDPHTMQVMLAAKLLSYEPYKELDGKRIKLRNLSEKRRRWLQAHWAHHTPP